MAVCVLRMMATMVILMIAMARAILLVAVKIMTKNVGGMRMRPPYLFGPCFSSVPMPQQHRRLEKGSASKSQSLEAVKRLGGFRESRKLPPPPAATPFIRKNKYRRRN